MKELPLGRQDFSEIINDDLLYIDKTDRIYKLIQKGKLYFLSRPRRFGKSLLISLLGDLFEGKKELFENELFISPDTVRYHLKNIYKKLQVNSKYEAMMKAMKNGLV